VVCVSAVEWLVDSVSEEDTRALGTALGRVLAAGDVVLLDGHLGAGKTHFVQGVALGLGVPEDRRVNSPTFAIVNEHPGRLRLNHMDLYRIDDPGELDHIGIREYLEGGGVTAVEWGARLGQHTPGSRLEIRIEVVDAERRRLYVHAFGDAVARLEAWQKEPR
jgi:tRNA threonylcarbamoyladenosine biosynthesis protein TsaE